jgi:membrane protease YdiL (CAAX protease family)
VIPARSAVATWFACFLAGNIAAPLAIVLVGQGDVDVSSQPIWVLAMVSVITWSISLWGVARLCRIHAARSLRQAMQIRFSPRDALGVPLGVASQLILVPVVMLPLRLLFPDSFSPEKIEKRATDLVDNATGAWMIVLVLVVVVGAPLVEEIVYRGMLQGSISTALGRSRALVLVAAWFAAIHFVPVEFVGLFAFALVLGWVFERNEALGMNIITHMAFNATGLVLVALT